MTDINKLYEKLVKSLPGHVFDFCIMNDDDFSAMQIFGKVVKENDKYFFVMDAPIEKKQLLECNPEEESNYNKMVKNPQNIYCGMIKIKETFYIRLIYYTGADEEGENLLNEYFWTEYLKCKKINTYKDFIKCLRKCIREHNKIYSDDITLDYIFSDYKDFYYIDE